MYMVARRYQCKTQDMPLLEHNEKLLFGRQIFQAPLFLLTEREDMKTETLQMSWFSHGQQLSPTQPLAHSPLAARERELKEK